MAERELLVRIVGDDRDLQRALGNTSRSVENIDRRTATFGKNLKSAFGAAGLTLGLSTAAAVASRFAQAASAQNEEVSKSIKIFGDSSDSIDDWSKTSANAFGVSRTEALQATGIFGNLFRVVEIGTEQSAEMSQKLVELAADLASFNNANPEEVLQAIRSGLIGEAEPLRRYGVLLSETRVQQEALVATGKKNVTELTNQEKALARYNIILNDTIPAQGDFADTADEAANAGRRASAEYRDFAANVGQILVPALQGGELALAAFFAELNAGIGSIGDFRSALRDTSAFDGFNAGVEDANGRLAGFFLNLRDGIPLLGDFKRAVQDAAGGADQSFDEAGALAIGDESRRGSPGAVSASNATRAAKDVEQRAKRAVSDLERSRKVFSTFIKGLGLKLETAGLTEDEGDDIAVLREIKRRIERQIQTEGRTFALAQQLVRVRQQIADKIASQERDQEQKATDTRQATADKAEQERAKRRRINEREAAARKAEQFESLGLTGSGDARTPGTGALLRRAQGLQEQVKGTALDSGKTREQLQRIVSTLRKNFKSAGRDVRQAILEMLNDIDSALNGGKSTSGPLTKTSSINSNKFLDGLGLSEEQARQLRARLSNFNSAGKGFSPTGNRPTGGFRGGEDKPVVVESHTTINLDGQKVATVVTRNQQKAASRNPRQKRGPNRHQN